MAKKPRKRARKSRKSDQIDVARLKKDPAYFAETVIGHKLAPFQKDWFSLALNHKRLCLMAFRSSGKTSQLIENYLIWHALVKPGTKYMVVSRSLSQAREILKEIRTRILTTPLLKSLVPKNRSQAWSASEIELANHSRILARPYNENVRGLHVHGVCCDEMGEYEDHAVLEKAILPTIRAKRGFFIGIGTPKSELDMLHEIERDPGHSSIHFDRFPAEGDKGNLFEERYPDTYIDHDDAVYIRDKSDKSVIETYSNMTWSQEFLLKPVSLKDKVFPDHLIEACLDPKAGFETAPKNLKQYFIGVDFAMSAQSGSDYTVVTVIEKSPGSNKLRIVDIHRWKGLDYIEQKARIQQISENFQAIKVLGDESSFGKTFIYDLKAAGVPIDGFAFSAKSGSKEELIKALRDQFEKQGFVIPYDKDDVRAFSTVRTLIDELTKFGITFNYRTNKVSYEGTGRHDDMVISLALANFIARHVTMGLFSAVKGHTSNRKNPFLVSVR